MRFQAYNETAVGNLQIQETAKDLFEDKLLTPPQLEAVKTAFPVNFKQSNIFIKIGSFLFTGLCTLFLIVLIGWLIGLGNEVTIGGFLLFLGVSLTVLNEYLIRENQWYRNGSDNALCYASIICFAIGIGFILNIHGSLEYAFLFFLFSSIAAWRYGDPLLTFGAFYTFFILFMEMFTANNVPLIAIPFSFAILSFATYTFAKSGLKRPDWFYWEYCFKILEIVSLVAIYGALNYFVNHQLTISFDYQNAEKPLTLGILFAIFTAIIPILYLFIGIKNKDRIMWIIGGLGIIASILTYRQYYHIMPIEWVLTLSGIALIAFAVFLIKYLKTPKNGFAFQPERTKSNPLEALIFNEILQHNNPQNDTGTRFGGGDFGGGGASEKY
jgi:hypothetical protein